MNAQRSDTADAADFVVVANRLPVDLVYTPDGGRQWRRSPGGLVSALEPFLGSRNGAWVGWPGVADESVESFHQDGIDLHPVRLSADEIRDYYEGFSNATLWPLYHDVVVRPEFHRHWWNSYVQVNNRFAEAVAAVAAPNAVVWVQDYQLQLVPEKLRALRPDLRIGFFLHIPFPPVELFMQLPWRTELTRGLLGADLVGFHTPGGAQNFSYLARRLGDGRGGKAQVGWRTRTGKVFVGEREVHVGAFPISIDGQALTDLVTRPDIQKRSQEMRQELGGPSRVMLGVDRLDYTKGIDVRLHALDELLAEGRVDPEDVVMVQLATPSRERIEHYQRMRGDIEYLVGRINGEYGRVGKPVVHYIHKPVGRDELVALYAGSDVMVVTALRDGMNLVAKEYVACRKDLGGALVLSEFAGAAAELGQAYLVNPHDLNGVKNAILSALYDPQEDRTRRMRAMRRQVLTHDVNRWASEFLETLGAA